jgi:hypothetical protein
VQSAQDAVASMDKDSLVTIKQHRETFEKRPKRVDDDVPDTEVDDCCSTTPSS